MGLCKCPKKKVTNLFCYEHRVNVCDSCMTENHPKCVVQSYLAWLQDSDYDPSCHLCHNNLVTSDGGPETVRLVCLHVFHWRCLDAFARSHPANTAPAGYLCPTCKFPIFPKENQVSPVVSALKTLLKTTNWARAGLGLPLIDEPTRPEFERSFAPVHGQSEEIPQPNHSNSHYKTQSIVLGLEGQQEISDLPDSLDYNSPLPRKTYGTPSSESVGVTFSGKQAEDSDENKYKRRSALQWFNRWLKSRTVLAPRSKDPLLSCKRIFFLLIVVIVALMTFIMTMTSVGRSVAESDPLLDPMANPNIHIGQQLAES